MTRILHFTEITLIIIMIDSHKWNNPVSQTQMQQSNNTLYYYNKCSGMANHMFDNGSAIMRCLWRLIYMFVLFTMHSALYNSSKFN